MKTKILALGVIVAALSMLSVKVSKAQALAEPSVKVMASNEDQVKLIYGYAGAHDVDVKFIGSDGLIETDHISGKDFDNGFIKRYNVKNLRGKAFWVEVESAELSVLYRLTPARNGKWSAALEKTTFNYPTVASN